MISLFINTFYNECCNKNIKSTICNQFNKNDLQCTLYCFHIRFFISLNKTDMEEGPNKDAIIKFKCFLSSLSIMHIVLQNFIFTVKCSTPCIPKIERLEERVHGGFSSLHILGKHTLKFWIVPTMEPCCILFIF